MITPPRIAKLVINKTSSIVIDVICMAGLCGFYPHNIASPPKKSFYYVPNIHYRRQIQ
ncbi:MAG: hypothetical protein ACI9C4_001307 [Paraglaciecola sp.]